MALTRAQVTSVLTAVLRVVPTSEVRLVGTASSLLRGIDLPVMDIDVLFRRRPDIDGWHDALRADHDVETSPLWLPDTMQYFARIHVDGIRLELSTVEIATDADTFEGFGPGPWTHFDAVVIADREMPAVASELRFLSEWSRHREDRAKPLLEFLRTHPCDLDLIRRGLTGLGEQPSTIEQVLELLT